MKLVSITLMLLGSLAFLGADTARLDTSLQFRKKWNKWALSRGKRELQAPSSYPTVADEKTVPTQTLVQLQDTQNTTSTPQASNQSEARNQSEAHIRVKRYRQSMNQGSRSSGCRIGTCTMQKLAHQIYQLTDKDKDGMAPRNKISPQGYGRRRRRSLPEVLRARTVESSQEQTHAAAASRAHISRLFRI
ncbi:ADM [Grammomys surdaster]|uniref:ADM n=1 Tax=Grammomys surdaster TaxID=491861 RepID=UPI00109F5075|nr:ADM [Grammomys surdaster]